MFINKNQKIIHFLIENLGYKINQKKCNLAIERINQTGLFRYILFSYLFIGNLFKNSYFFYKIYKKTIFYKFLAGIIILVFESNTEFNNLIKNNIYPKNLNSKIYDTIVVGSGPGGSIAALRLTQNNEDVLIIESGEAYTPGSIRHHSFEQTNLQFYKQGINFCYGNVPMLFAEGSTYGGGSEVNSGLYFKLTEPYKSAFLEKANISSNEWNKVEKKVEDMISVQHAPPGSFKNLKSALIDGSNNLGLICEEIPRWRQYEPTVEHKSMQVTYLKEAEDNGLSVLTGTEVIKINLEDDFVSIVAKNKEKIINFRSKKIVLSAGTIGTPKILKNSGLIKNKIKFNFHPMNRCVVDYGVEVNDGDLFPPFQSWTKDYRFKFGYSVSTYPFVKATLASLGKYENFPKPSNLVCYFSSTVLDNSRGRLISFNKNLIPIIYLKKQDRKKIKEGFEILMKLLSTTDVSNIWPKKGISPMTTVHVFGSLPIGDNSEIGINGELLKDNRIKICDASILPAAPWGNPQAVMMVLNEILFERWIRSFL